jgi:hypothetical protein
MPKFLTFSGVLDDIGIKKNQQQQNTVASGRHNHFGGINTLLGII